MANIIKFKRGLVSNLASANLETGEPAFTTDEKAFYINDGTSDIMVGKEGVLASGDDISQLNNDVGFVDSSDLTTALGGYVPTSRTVNTHPLSSNIVLTASDVSAVPLTRTVNSKALSSDITLTASDVGALDSNSIIDGGTF